jgi:uncharacterized protein YlzI (FlbEa/FlbD family)
MVKLPRPDGLPVFVNPEQVCKVTKDPLSLFTLIVLSGGETRVTEAPAEVVKECGT